MGTRKLKAGEKLVAEITVTLVQKRSDPEGVFTQYTDFSLRAPFFKLESEEQATMLKRAMKGGTIDVEAFNISRARRIEVTKARDARNEAPKGIQPCPGNGG